MFFRAGSTAAAAHAIVFQVWLASSLLVDALAIAAQTLVGTALVADPQQALRTIRRVLQLSVALGLTLGVALMLGRNAVPALFTNDAETAAMAARLMPIAALSQPVNALAFAWDGIMFGADGFKCASTALAPSLRFAS